MRLAGLLVALAVAACGTVDATAGDAAGDAAVADAPVVDAMLGDAAIDAAPGNAPYLAIAPGPIDFGDVDIDEPPPSRTATITNLGAQPTGVLLGTSHAGLVIAQNDCVTLASGQSCTATLVLDVGAPQVVQYQLRAFATSGGQDAVAEVRARAGHRLTVETAGGGGRVVANAVGLDCTSACDVIVPATSVVLEVQPFAGWSFVWDGLSGPAATENPKTIPMNTGYIVRVTFLPIVDAPPVDAPPVDAGVTDAATDAPIDGGPVGGYVVTVNATPGGRVLSTPAGIDCPGTCTATFPGSSVTLDAQASPGYVTGLIIPPSGASCADPVSATCQATLTGPATFDITFHPPGTFVLQQPGKVFHNLRVSWGSQSQECMFYECAFAVGQGTVVTVDSIAPSVLTANGTTWDPPCPGSPCTYTVNGATRVRITSNATAPTRWGRRLPTSVIVRSVAGLPGGGALVAGSDGGTTWIMEYALDGSPRLPSTEDPTPGNDTFAKVAADPLGGFYAVVTLGGTDHWLRRYANVGVLTWAIDLPDGANPDLAVDGSGNVYVASSSTLSYSRAGVLRWTGAGAALIAVKGQRVGVAGPAYIAMYDLQGSLLWQQAPSPYFTPGGIAVDDVGGRVEYVLVGGMLHLISGYANAAQVTPWQDLSSFGPKYNKASIFNNLGRSLRINEYLQGGLELSPAVEPTLSNGGTGSVDDAGRRYIVARSTSVPWVTLLLASD